MCFAPQRRALFRHRNFQKWSERGVFCTFWLGNVLRATTACTFSTLQLPKVVRQNVFCTFWLGNVLRATTASTFSTSQLPKVVRSWCVLYSYDLEMCFAPQRRAIFHLSSDGSAPAALASLLFDPPEPQIIGKTQWIATFLPFRASASSFFWLFLFSDLLSSVTLPISTFHLSILSEVWLLNFLR